MVYHPDPIIFITWGRGFDGGGEARIGGGQLERVNAYVCPQEWQGRGFLIMQFFVYNRFRECATYHTDCNCTNTFVSNTFRECIQQIFDVHYTKRASAIASCVWASGRGVGPLWTIVDDKADG